MDYTSMQHFVSQVRGQHRLPGISPTALAAQAIAERERERVRREYEKILTQVAHERELACQKLRRECETLLHELYVLEDRYYRHDMHRPVHEWGTPSIPVDIEKAARAYTNAMARLRVNSV